MGVWGGVEWGGVEWISMWVKGQVRGFGAVLLQAMNTPHEPYL